MKTVITALLSGLLFGAGLTISSMVDPARVLGFLDIFGDWDPTLAFVMGGGLAVYLPVYQLVIKPKKQTLFNTPCHIPESTTIDKRLIIGSILFGLGWGLSGICPGPGLTNLSGAEHGIFVFVITMLFGMMAASKVK